MSPGCSPPTGRASGATVLVIVRHRTVGLPRRANTARSDNAYSQPYAQTLGLTRFDPTLLRAWRS
jgi:hypothetical protein